MVNIEVQKLMKTMFSDYIFIRKSFSTWIQILRHFFIKFVYEISSTLLYIIINKTKNSVNAQ